MRTALAVILAVVLGVAAGLGTALLRLGTTPWGSDGDLGAAADAGQRPPSGPPKPTVVVEREEYEFGDMDAGAKGSHDFVFQNTGDAPLTLSGGETSCRCAVSDIEAKEVPPGGSTKVTVRWTANEFTGAYRQTATILTNDPARQRVTLSVAGRITVAVRPVPREVVFGRVPASEAASAETALFCHLDQPLEIIGYKLADQETAAQFAVTFEPLPPDRLKEDPGAQSGVLVKVGVKSGLPQGPFRQTILLRTNLEAEPAVTIAVEGTIVGDIAVVGPGWDERTGVLTLGTVDSQTGAQRRLMLVVRGPHRKEVKFRVAQVSPEFLKVTLGEASEINNGLVIQTPLIIEIPKGSPRASYLGSGPEKFGRVTIETSHPNVPQVRVHVDFAVEG